MEEQRLLRLGRGYNGFFCPDSRFHLIGGIKPQGVYPADVPLSESVKRGLRGGGLVDVNKVIPKEEILTAKQLAKLLAEQGEEVQEPVIAKVPESTPEASPTKEDESDKKAEVKGLTTEEIEKATKAELLEYIKENSDITLEDIDLNSRSNATEIKTALNKYFGHVE